MARPFDCNIVNIGENSSVSTDSDYTPSHDPVMLQEVLDVLHPQEGESVLDVTLGLGGHSEAFIERVGESGSLIALDADRENLLHAEQRLENMSVSIQLYHANFITIDSLKLQKFDVIFADLGLSSPHIDDSSRGFTFQQDVPLDLRFDRSQGETGVDLIANASEDQLAHILREYGEVPSHRKLAREMKSTNISTTGDVKKCVEAVFHFKAKSHMAQVFQALRIAVNKELEALEVLLDIAPTLLKDGGRLGILTYHSLEDRLVKHKFRDLSAPEIDDYTGAISKEAPYELITKKPIYPSEEECKRNKRARSAKLRVLQKRPTDS